MRANSLALRLFLSATVWTALILLVTGFALSSLYRNSVERGFDRRIGVYLKTLIADLASPDIPIEKTGQMLSPCVEIDGQMLADVSGDEVEAYMLSKGLVQRSDRAADAPTNQPCAHEMPQSAPVNFQR